MNRFKKIANDLREFSIPLILGVVLALVWNNIDTKIFNSQSYLQFINNDLVPGISLLGHKITFYFLVNDIFMVLFFGIAAIEITTAFLKDGPLNPISKSINPLMGTLGGVVGPIGVFFLLTYSLPLENLLVDVSMKDILNGWGIPTATDIALAWLFAGIIFGRSHPVISFLLLLAIADDAIGLVIIAIFYPSPEFPIQPIFLLINVAAILIAFGLRKKNVQSIWAYFFLAGIPSWIGLLLTHVHPALALVPILPFLPAIRKNANKAAPLYKFEHTFKQPVELGLFFFGIANAGVGFSTINQITLIIFLALFIGKPMGIFSFSYFAKRILKFPLPNHVGYKELLVAGLIAGTGLTVALFVSGQAYSHPLLQGSAKMGALLSILCVPFAWLLTKALKIKKIHNTKLED